jgi:eukaryotic-like serine/threonine-protein kinase
MTSRRTLVTIAGEDTLDGASATGERAGRLGRGTCIDRYVVVDRVGVGGMGVVYAAYDPELDRKVAVKLLRAGNLSPQRAERRRSRLIREAQAMARLSHPNVVTVHDVGTHGDQVFVAMEFIDGPDLRTWLKQETRSWKEVTDMFIAAGRGLAAAHRAGIIHRDFKPDNVMIDAEGRVKVMDLGLARGDGTKETQTNDPEPLTAKLLDATLTRDGVIVGTPAYMSPEMHKGLDVDTRSDQFSFCVAFYEALYGQRPFTGETMASVALEIVKGRVRPPPSERRVPSWLRKVVHRGLAKDPKNRFTSMDLLVAELERDRGRPRRIAAYSGAAVVTGAAVAWVGVGAGGDGTPCEGGRASMQELWDDAERTRIASAFSRVATPFSTRAWTLLETTTDEYVDRWVAMHRSACEETHVHGRQSDALLDLRMACLDRRREELRALLEMFATADRIVVERSYAALGSMTPLDVCSDADELLAKVPLPDNPDARRMVERVRSLLADARARRSTGRVADSLGPAREGVALARSLGHAPTLAEALLELGHAQAAAGEPQAARETIEEALAHASAGKHDEAVASAWVELLRVIGSSLESPEALTLESAARLAVRRIGDPPRHLASFHRVVGAALRTNGRFDEAHEHLQEARQLAAGHLGEDHPTHGAILQSLGLLAMQAGRYEEARGYLERALEHEEASVGPDHPSTASTVEALGIAALRQGRIGEAETTIRRAHALRLRVLPPGHKDIAHSHMNLAVVAYDRGDIEAALEHEQLALQLLLESLGPEHPDVAAVIGNLGNSFARVDRHEEAIEHHRRALDLTERHAGPKHPRVARHHNNLGFSLTQIGRNHDALPHFEHALALWTEVGGPDHPEVGLVHYNLANTYRELGDARRAIDHAERAVAVRTRALGVDHDLTASARFALSKALWAAGDVDAALTQARATRDALAQRDAPTETIDAWLAQTAR